MAHSNELLSSPDPLGVSQENIEALQPSRQRAERPRLTPTKPLANTSNNVQRQEFYVSTPPANRNSKSSPSKLVAEVENPTSPWRIRVTVEAEQDNAQQSSSLTSEPPGKRFAERTTTTKVPLRDAGEKSPAILKKGRGRPRKPMDNPEKTPTTPRLKWRARREATPNAFQKTAKEDGYQITPPAKRARRGRPRKSTEHLEEESAQDREKAHSAQAHAINHTSDARTASVSSDGSGALNEEISSMNSAPTSGSTSQDRGGPSVKDLLGVESMEFEDTQDALSSPHSDLQDPTDEHQDFDSILESEGFSMVSVSSLSSAKIDSNSVLEPKMNRECTESCDRRTGKSSTLDVPEGFMENLDRSSSEISSPRSSLASPLKLQVLKHDQASTTLSLSTSVPPEVKASASQQSPRPLGKPPGGTPKLGRVVRAGIALQGVLNPRNIRSPPGRGPEQGVSSTSSPSAKSPKERLDKLFSGFSAGTRRELRAGLRLGEELAKRQHILTSQPLAKHMPEDDVFGQDDTTGYPKLPSHNGESEYSLKLPEPTQTSLYPNLAHSQLPSPERSEVDDEDRMSWRVDTPNPSEVQNVRTGHGFRESESSQEFQGSSIAQEPLELRVESAAQEKGSRLEGAALEEYFRQRRVQEEEEYRAERAAVVRQIDMANSSQVNIINSDSEEGDEFEEDDGDIWQEQAHSSTVVSEPEDEDPAVLLLNKDPQPRRSLIPSPWRRHADIASVSQVSTNDSDLFWQPSQMANNTGESELMDEMLDQGLKSGRSPGSNASNQWDEVVEPEFMPHSGAPSSDIHARQISVTVKEPPKAFAAVTDVEKQGDDRKKYTGKDFAGEIKVSVTGSARKSSPVKSITKPAESPAKFALVQDSLAKPVLTSWLGYLAGFVPAWREPTPAVPSRLPNGQSKLPRAGNLERPFSLYTPWKDAHFDALYFHYAASKEGRRRYDFNPKSASAPLLGFVHRHRGWEKALTKEDLAIVDAFMIGLKAKGRSKHAAGEKLIDEKLAGWKVFRLWYGGVQRGECEVGIGKTGLVSGSKEIWRPELEPWFKKK